MSDDAIKYGRIRQETRFSPQGTEESWIIVPIWIGGHGPFTERFSQAEYSDGFTLQQRIEKLRQTLTALPK